MKPKPPSDPPLPLACPRSALGPPSDWACLEHHPERRSGGILARCLSHLSWSSSQILPADPKSTEWQCPPMNAHFHIHRVIPCGGNSPKWKQNPQSQCPVNLKYNTMVNGLHLYTVFKHLPGTPKRFTKSLIHPFTHAFIHQWVAPNGPCVVAAM